jgi:hypothetical protein
VVEKFAVRGLAADPGMGLRLFHTAAEIADAGAVRFQAAKQDLFAERSPSAKLIDGILAGRSLAAFGPPPPTASVTVVTKRGRRAPGSAIPQTGSAGVDPIASVMVAGKVSVGRYGGTLRRLLLSAGRLDPETVRRVQALTEQATQKALSVKAGDQPLSFAAFDRWVRQLVRPREDGPVEPPAGLSELLPVWGALRRVRWTPDEPWLAWLRAQLPADDLRASGWFAPG